MGPRPNPDDDSPLTMKRLSRIGILPIRGEPSREKGMSPAHERAIGKLVMSGMTSAACPLFTSIPERSSLVL